MWTTINKKYDIFFIKINTLKLSRAATHSGQESPVTGHLGFDPQEGYLSYSPVLPPYTFCVSILLIDKKRIKEKVKLKTTGMQE